MCLSSLTLSAGRAWMTLECVPLLSEVESQFEKLERLLEMHEDGHASTVLPETPRAAALPEEAMPASPLNSQVCPNLHPVAVTFCGRDPGVRSTTAQSRPQMRRLSQQYSQPTQAPKQAKSATAKRNADARHTDRHPRLQAFKPQTVDIYPVFIHTYTIQYTL